MLVLGTLRDNVCISSPCIKRMPCGTLYRNRAGAHIKPLTCKYRRNPDRTAESTALGLWVYGSEFRISGLRSLRAGGSLWLGGVL